jgi:hypothetical protein
VYIHISAIEIQTTALILMKFGMEILLIAGKVPSRVATPYSHPWGKGALNRVWPASAASTVRLGENFLKKVVGHPCFSGVGSHFWTCNPDPEGSGPYVFLEP